MPVKIQSLSLLIGSGRGQAAWTPAFPVSQPCGQETCTRHPSEAPQGCLSLLALIVAHRQQWPWGPWAPVKTTFLDLSCHLHTSQFLSFGWNIYTDSTFEGQNSWSDWHWMTIFRAVEGLIYLHKENLQPTAHPAGHSHPRQQNDRLKRNYPESSSQFIVAQSSNKHVKEGKIKFLPHVLTSIRESSVLNKREIVRSRSSITKIVICSVCDFCIKNSHNDISGR